MPFPQQRTSLGLYTGNRCKSRTSLMFLGFQSEVKSLEALYTLLYESEFWLLVRLKGVPLTPSWLSPPSHSSHLDIHDGVFSFMNTSTHPTTYGLSKSFFVKPFDLRHISVLLSISVFSFLLSVFFIFLLKPLFLFLVLSLHPSVSFFCLCCPSDIPTHNLDTIDS